MHPHPSIRAGPAHSPEHHSGAGQAAVPVVELLDDGHRQLHEVPCMGGARGSRAGGARWGGSRAGGAGGSRAGGAGVSQAGGARWGGHEREEQGGSRWVERGVMGGRSGGSRAGGAWWGGSQAGAQGSRVGGARAGHGWQGHGGVTDPQRSACPPPHSHWSRRHQRLLRSQGATRGRSTALPGPSTHSPHHSGGPPKTPV